MKLLKTLVMAALLALAPIADADASQATLALPTTGPLSFSSFVSTYLNPALAAVLTNSSGTAAPSVSGQPGTFQFWVDTSTTPRVLKIYDGTSWLSLGTLDTSGHFWGATSSSLTLAGSSSGTTKVQASAAASGTLTLPAATDTLLGKATTDTLTNKTLDTAATGNSFKINGTAITAVTGTGSVALSNSPTFVTPALGTPASGVATNLTGLPVATGISGLGTGTATWLATPSSANLAAAMTDETGTGANVFANSPVLVTPNLGTPSAATLTNATGLPVGSGVSGLGTGVATWLATPSSANLASAVTGTTGSGNLVFANSPALTTPNIGVASATTVNKLAITAPTTGSTLAVADGKTATVSNTLTLAGTDATTMTFPSTSATLARTDAGNTFTGHQTIEGVTSAGATGTGNLVFSNSPTLATPNLGTPSAVTLTNGTGLPISGGVSGLATGIATWLGSPSSANLLSALTDETGTGVAVFGTSPTLATPVINGLPTGTGVAAGATASTLAARNANANVSANAFVAGYATTVTAAGTTTFTVGSAQLQYFTGTSTQTVALPVVSTLVLGQSWTIVNNSSGAVSVNSSGGNLVLTVAAGNTGIFTVVSTSGTTAASWSSTYISSGAGTGTVTSVTCGAPLTGGTITTTGTCTFPSGTQWGIPYYSSSTGIASTAAGTSTTILHGNASGGPSWAALAYGDIASGAIATAANYQANAASTLLGPNAVWSAAGTTALTDATTIAVDMSTGINFTVTLAGNRTLGAPSNTKVGQSGVFRVSQDGTGSRTLAYNAVYKFAGGSGCTLTTTASHKDYIFYWVFSSSEILLSCVLDVSMIEPANDNLAFDMTAVG